MRQGAEIFKESISSPSMLYLFSGSQLLSRLALLSMLMLLDFLLLGSMLLKPLLLCFLLPLLLLMLLLLLLIPVLLLLMPLLLLLIPLLLLLPLLESLLLIPPSFAFFGICRRVAPRFPLPTSFEEACGDTRSRGVELAECNAPVEPLPGDDNHGREANFDDAIDGCMITVRVKCSTRSEGLSLVLASWLPYRFVTPQVQSRSKNPRASSIGTCSFLIRVL